MARVRTGQGREGQGTQDRAGPDSTAQQSTAQHSTAQHSTAQHSTAQHSTAQHSTSQRNNPTAQRSTTQHTIAHRRAYIDSNGKNGGGGFHGRVGRGSGGAQLRGKCNTWNVSQTMSAKLKTQLLLYTRRRWMRCTSTCRKDGFIVNIQYSHKNRVPHMVFTGTQHRSYCDDIRY